MAMQTFHYSMLSTPYPGMVFLYHYNSQTIKTTLNL